MTVDELIYFLQKAKKEYLGLGQRLCVFDEDRMNGEIDYFDLKPDPIYPGRDVVLFGRGESWYLRNRKKKES